MKRSAERIRQSQFREYGLALLETAIVAPFLIFLVFATVEFGRYYSVRINLENAARRALDYAMRSPDTAVDADSIESYAKEELEGVFGYDETNLTIGPSSVMTLDSGEKGTEVTLSYRFNSLIKYPGLPRDILLTRTLTARLLSDS